MSHPALAACLVVGNFIYQWLQAFPDWLVASERSFFQVLAVAAAYWIAKK